MSKVKIETKRFMRRWTASGSVPVGRFALLGMAFLVGMVAA
jgi:hypothetical protein